MSYLLRVSVSLRGEKSWSLKLRDEFTEQFLALHPGVEVRDRHTFPIPHLSLVEMIAGQTRIAEQSPEHVAAFALANELSEEVLQASAIVISTPMNNWGPPSSLKAWFDRIINAKTYFREIPALRGIPITFIVASGGTFSFGQSTEHDHLRPLLIECVSRLGADDFAFVNCDPTIPLDAKKMAPDDPESGYLRAQREFPAAAARIRK